jgi:hypothetical protein
MSASLETTVEVGESLTGEPSRHPLQAKQRSSPTRPLWLRAYASPDPYFKGSKLSDNMLPQRPRVKQLRSPGRYYPLGRHGHAPQSRSRPIRPLPSCRCLALAMLGLAQRMIAEICQVEEVAAEEVSTISKRSEFFTQSMRSSEAGSRCCSTNCSAPDSYSTSHSAAGSKDLVARRV